MFIKRLHPLYDVEGDIGTESGVDTTQVAAEQTETPVIESGAEKEVAAEPNNYEKAFAKRLAAKEAEWEAKNAEKYKDYDTFKKTTSYFQQRHGYTDLMAMNEDIELAELQARAEKENVPTEVLKRIDQLEAEAAEGKVLKEQQQQQQQYQTFRSNLEKFATEKQSSADELHQYMFENQFPPDKMELAFKTMQADKVLAEKEAFEAGKEQFKKDTIKEYFYSKKAPKAEGKGAAGVVGQGRAGSMQAADARFKARIEAANNSV
jgi:hypothetical protein